MTHRIGKRWTFDAAHQLAHLPDGHKCARLHGHTYTVEVGLVAEDLDDDGFVFDYGALAPFKAWIDANVDHRNLNDVAAVPFTTAEHLAAWLYQVLVEDVMPTYVGDTVGAPEDLVRFVDLVEYVEVRETANTFARYTP